MNRNKHLLLWSSLGVLALLVVAAVDENFLKDWRRIQRRAASPSGPAETHLRQIVIPGLRVTDRCVSCHVGMAPGEQAAGSEAILAAHRPMHHDPAEFGCVVCHGGQGRATERKDAHGDVPFWPSPMIPSEYAYAGCGSCHAYVRVPDRIRLEEGLALFERYDCLACHRVDGRGGTIRPGGAGGMEGPDLSTAGASGYDSDWYERHLEAGEVEGSKGTGGPWQVSFGAIPKDDLEKIDLYLDSRVGAPGLVEAKATFHSLGCRGCHKIAGVGGDDGPDLTLMGDRDPARLDFSHVPGEPALANWLDEHFRSPSRVVPGSQMPALGLPEEEIRLLTFYMLSLRRSAFPEAYWPKDRIRTERFGEREFATDGATLYGTFCAACHGPSGEGMRYPGMPPFPAIGNPDFLAVASDDFLVETVRRGRPGRRMPAWGEKEGGLRPVEIEKIVRHLRARSGEEGPPPSVRRTPLAGDRAEGARVYEAVCAGCHGEDGGGGEGPALHNPVLLASATDSYLIETIGRGRRGTSMGGFRNPSPVRPTLSEEEIESIVAHMRTWEETTP